MYRSLIIILFISGIILVAKTEDINLDFKPCDGNNLNECFREIMQTQLVANANGNEALGIPSLEPWTLKKQRVDYNGTDGIQVSTIAENVKIYGFTKSIIKNVKTSLNEKGLRAIIEIHTPKSYGTGNYKANVVINELKFRPKGEFTVEIDNVNMISKIEAIFDIRDNKKFLNIKSIDLNPTVGEIKFNATGLFPDPALNEFAIGAVNRYLPNFYKRIVTESKIVWEPLIIKTASDFFNRVSFDKFFQN